MTQDVIFTQEGQLGLITLNRPSALNALTFHMILALQEQLQSWKDDKAIQAVVLRAAPGNAFCAGGDIRMLYSAGKTHKSQAMEFFWHEYRLNHFIHHFGKPYISLMDGMTMGGGVGVGMHGSHPVASERFVFAMPETGIGFFPDIGASHLLSNCPGYLGIYLGLTGNRLGPQDAMRAGLVKQTVSSENMPLFLKALLKEDLSHEAHTKVDKCLQAFAWSSPMTEESQHHALIDDCFVHEEVEMIQESLESTKDDWAMKVLKTLSQKSPLSLKITLAQLKKAEGMTLADCLKMDYDLVGHFIDGTDFYEGVRALLIDKDKNPHWDPAELNQVSKSMVADYFVESEPELEFIV